LKRFAAPLLLLILGIITPGINNQLPFLLIARRSLKVDFSGPISLNAIIYA